MKRFRELLEGKNYCKHFNRGTETCTSGCPEKKIKKGSHCPYEEDYEDCPCSA